MEIGSHARGKFAFIIVVSGRLIGFGCPGGDHQITLGGPTAWLLLADFDFAFINSLISKIPHLIACSAPVPRGLRLVTLSAELLDHSPG